MSTHVQPPPDLAHYGIESHWLQRAQAVQNLLFVYAHPDDETFGSAGTIARYSAAGVAVHSVCATYGECGTVSSTLLEGYADVMAVRRAELLCAARTLNLASVHFLGYRDSGMAGTSDNQHPRALVQAPVAQVVRQVTAAIRALRPQVVVTFNRYGGYGHPDHMVANQATVAAFHAAGDPHQYTDSLAPWTPQKLYYSTFDARWLKLIGVGLRVLGKDPTRFGANGDVDLVAAVAHAGSITTSLQTSAYLDQTERAWQCHRSQIGDMALLLKLPRFMRRKLVGKEHFTRIVPAWQAGQQREDDLFAGLSS
jgi:LmbE family N-acetylglucosaminyl deacetylase